MLIEDETCIALEVRDSITKPDTPILALPKSGNNNQKWKYSMLMLPVSINFT